MARNDVAVRIDGLADMRRLFRATDREALREVQAVQKDAAGIVAVEAARLAPRGTRPIPKSRRPHLRLYQSYRPYASGNKAGIRSRLPYAPIKEFRKTGTPAQMRGVAPVGRAMQAKEREVAHRLADGFDDAIRRAGWH